MYSVHSSLLLSATSFSRPGWVRELGRLVVPIQAVWVVLGIVGWLGSGTAAVQPGGRKGYSVRQRVYASGSITCVCVLFDGTAAVQPGVCVVACETVRYSVLWCVILCTVLYVVVCDIVCYSVL